MVGRAAVRLSSPRKKVRTMIARPTRMAKRLADAVHRSVPPHLAALVICERVDEGPRPGQVSLLGAGNKFVAAGDGLSLAAFYVLVGGQGPCSVGLEFIHRNSGLCLGKPVPECEINPSLHGQTGVIAVNDFQFTGTFDVHLLIDGNRAGTITILIADPTER